MRLSRILSRPAYLTRRQKEVLELAAQGLTMRQMAGRLSISIKTVDNHLQAIRNTLCVDSTLYAIKAARHEGLITVAAATDDSQVRSAAVTSYRPLTKRQEEILTLTAQGYSSKHIARSLRIALATVHRHKSHIYHSLGVHNSTQAIEKESMRREQLPPDMRWHCFFCSAVQWNKPLIYAVPLCPLCIAKAADDPTKGYYLQSRVYVLTRKLEAATRWIGRLQTQIAALNCSVQQEGKETTMAEKQKAADPNPSGEATMQRGAVTGEFDLPDAEGCYVHAYGGIVDDSTPEGTDLDTLSGRCYMTFGDSGEVFFDYRIDEAKFPSAQKDVTGLSYTGYYGKPDALEEATCFIGLNNDANSFWFALKDAMGNLVRQIPMTRPVVFEEDGAVQVSQDFRA